jgi:hypothetical protein
MRTNPWLTFCLAVAGLGGWLVGPRLPNVVELLLESCRFRFVCRQRGQQTRGRLGIELAARLLRAVHRVAKCLRSLVCQLTRSESLESDFPFIKSVLRRFAGAIGSAGGNAILAYVGKSLVAALDWKLPMQDALAQPNLVARGPRGNGEVPKFSPAMLDEVVRRVVAHMSEQVVREIAWEVVPDLAERLIKQRLEEENPRTP